PRAPRSTTSREHVEAVVVVALVVLRLQLDPDPRSRGRKRMNLQRCAQARRVPTIQARTSRFQRALTWCMSNAAMPASRIAFTRPTSTAEARNPVRLVGRAPGGAAHRIEQRPNDARNVCLPRVETRARWGRCSRQGWE